jgi:ATP-dependent Zn protease
VDNAVHELLHAAENSAVQLLRSRRAELDRLITALEAEEDLERDRLEQLLGARRATAEDRPAAAS